MFWNMDCLCCRLIKPAITNEFAMVDQLSLTQFLFLGLFFSCKSLNPNSHTKSSIEEFEVLGLEPHKIDSIEEFVSTKEKILDDIDDINGFGPSVLDFSSFKEYDKDSWQSLFDSVERDLNAVIASRIDRRVAKLNKFHGLDKFDFDVDVKHSKDILYNFTFFNPLIVRFKEHFLSGLNRYQVYPSYQT